VAEQRICSPQFYLGAERLAADLAIVLVGWRSIGTLSQTRKTRASYHSLAGERSARLNGHRTMSGPEELEDAEDSDVVVAEQAPISVYTNEAGAVVINQFQWRDGPVCVFVLPHNVEALCRAMIDAAEVDLIISAEHEVTTKDATANERQRRHREKLRDRHGRQNVTVTAKPTSEVHGHRQESGSATTG
jgi:hypothetical protein